MKKYILYCLLILFPLSNTAQIIVDDGCVFSDMTRVNTDLGKWDKDTLTYYIDTNSTNQLTPAEIKLAVSKAFSEWSNHSTLTFIETNSNTADLRIKFVNSANHGDGQLFDNGQAAHSFPPKEDTYKGEMHLWNAYEWSTDESSNKMDLQAVVTHEIGHLLGLNHSDMNYACMYATYNKNHMRTLHIDDCKRIWILYGFPANRICIAGNSFLLSQNDYHVNNLPRGAGVNWLLSGNVPTNVHLISDSYNLCSIYQDERTDFNAYLNASITEMFSNVKTIKTYIFSTEGFSGTYSQNGYASNHAFTPDGPPIPIHPNEEMILTSPDFVGKTITHTGTTPYYFYYDYNNTVRIVMRNVSDGQRLYVNVNGESGSSYQITLRVTTYGSNYISDLNLSRENDNLIMSMVSNGNDEELNQDNNNFHWHYEVINPVNKQKVADKNVRGLQSIVNTSKWEKGMYIIKADTYDNTLTKKIYIQ